jgi:hypothetical protein
MGISGPTPPFGYSYHSMCGEKSMGVTGSWGIIGGFGGPAVVRLSLPVAMLRAAAGAAVAAAVATRRRSMAQITLNTSHANQVE